MRVNSLGGKGLEMVVQFYDRVKGAFSTFYHELCRKLSKESGDEQNP